MSCFHAIRDCFRSQPGSDSPPQVQCPDPDCDASCPSPQSPYPTGPERQNIAGIQFICKRHVQLSDGRYSPINLNCYKKLPPSPDAGDFPLTRAPVYLPQSSNVELGRHGVVHLPHTWMSCFHADGDLFINWATGIVQVDQPEVEPWLRRDDMIAWEPVHDDKRWPGVVARPAGPRSPDPSEQDLAPIDPRLRTLIREIIFSKHDRFGRRQTRNQQGSAHLAGLIGFDSFVDRINAEERAGGGNLLVTSTRTNAPGSIENDARTRFKQDARGIYVFPERGTRVRRRALLIACTYGKSPLAEVVNSKVAGADEHTEKDASELRGTVNDVVTMYKVLTKKRGWRPSDIVVLTDAGTRVELGCLRKDGVCIEESDIKSITLWLGKFVSGLDAENGDGQEQVSNSLFLFMAGHGCQYKEAAGAVPLESDGMDEGFWSSSIRVERSLTHTSEYHFGVLLDDDINALVCRIIHSLPRTQLVMVIDCCHAGTMADLPFLLNKSNEWETDGEARKLEKTNGYFPEVYDCSQGIVYSFAGSKDAETAINERQSILSKSLIASKEEKAPETNGAMTAAFASSDLASGNGSTLDGFLQIREKIKSNYTDWVAFKREIDSEMEKERLEKLEREHITGVKENGIENNVTKFRDVEHQEPEFASSHCCRIDQRPLYF